MKKKSKLIVVEAMQFTGLDSYLEIFKWMKESGDTWALANEIRYETPLMLMHNYKGLVAVEVNDYVVKDSKGRFHRWGGNYAFETLLTLDDVT